MATQLIAAAEKYEILDLKDICEDIIFRDITIKNALQTLTIADKYNANNINKILDFVVINMPFICNVSGTALDHIIVENPRLVSKIFRSIDMKSLLINCKNNCKERNWIYGSV